MMNHIEYYIKNDMEWYTVGSGLKHANSMKSIWSFGVKMLPVAADQPGSFLWESRGITSMQMASSHPLGRVPAQKRRSVILTVGMLNIYYEHSIIYNQLYYIFILSILFTAVNKIYACIGQRAESHKSISPWRSAHVSTLSFAVQPAPGIEVDSSAGPCGRSLADSCWEAQGGFGGPPTHKTKSWRITAWI